MNCVVTRVYFIRPVNEKIMQEFENVLKEIKSDVIGLSEVRKHGEKIMKIRSENYVLLFLW